MSLLDTFLQSVTGYFGQEEKKSNLSELQNAVFSINLKKVEELLETTTIGKEELKELENQAMRKLTLPNIQNRIDNSQNLCQIIFLLRKKWLNEKNDYFVSESLIRNYSKIQSPIITYCLGQIKMDGFIRVWQSSFDCVQNIFINYSKQQVNMALDVYGDEKDLVDLKVHGMAEYCRIKDIDNKTERDLDKLSKISKALVKNDGKGMMDALKMHRSTSIFTWLYNPTSYRSLSDNLVEKFDKKEEPEQPWYKSLFKCFG